MSKSFLEKWLPTKGALKCRHCGSENVRLSMQGNLTSRYVLYRCRDCKQHFKVAAEPLISFPVMVTILLIVLVIVVLGVSLILSDLYDSGVLHWGNE